MPRSQIGAVRHNKLVVFSGPPCSGKSTLAGLLAQRLGLSVLEMDDIRKTVFPKAEHNKADRDLAYRIMHREALQALRAHGRDLVIVAATFAPLEQRRELVAVADSCGAEIFLVECRVTPEEAVRRFRDRPDGHAGLDLTEERVRDLARGFPFYGGGLLLETDALSGEECVAGVTSFLATGPPMWSGTNWVEAGSGGGTVVDARERESATANAEHDPTRVRISPRSRRLARRKLIRMRALLYTSFLMGLAGALLVLGTAGREWWECGPIGWLGVSAHPPCELSSERMLGWAQAFLAFAVVAGGLLPLWELMASPQLHAAREVLDGGMEPRFGPARSVQLSNRAIFNEYHSRITPEGQARMRVDGVPLYFVVPPELGPCDVLVTSSAPLTTDKDLVPEATAAGFDWPAYLTWRRRAKEIEYYGQTVWEESLAISRLAERNDKGEIHVEGYSCPFYQYLCREQAVLIEVPGQLPHMRAFFEGPAWYGGATLNLSSLEDSWRYSRVVSVASLITTDDGYLILQRRSAFVGAAPGGMAASAAGFALWKDIGGGRHLLRRRAGSQAGGSRGVSLATAALREIREELGLEGRDFAGCFRSRPFLAAALNLRYGRDLNFYAHFHFTGGSRQLTDQFARRHSWLDSISAHVTGRAKDRWEIAHLVLVPLGSIDADGRLEYQFDRLLGDSRHVRGALYSLALSGRLGEIRSLLGRAHAVAGEATPS